MAKFKVGQWVQIENTASGVKFIGLIKSIQKDMNFNLFYSINWCITSPKNYTGLQPTSLYPIREFDKEGSFCPAGEVLYGKR